MKSLKNELQRIIRERGYLSTNQVEAYCKEHGYKMSNAERRLRVSDSPMIEAVTKNGAIIGYRPKAGTGQREGIDWIKLPDDVKITRTTYGQLNFPSAFPKKEENKTGGLF